MNNTVRQLSIFFVSFGVMILPSCTKKEAEPQSSVTPQAEVSTNASANPVAEAIEPAAAQSTSGGDYQHTVTVGDMTFDWSVVEGNLDVRLTAKTEGWVAIGFNATEKMKDANIIIGYVRNNNVVIEDHFGNSPEQHKKDTLLGGSNNLSNLGGKQDNGQTELRFTLPLDSGDDKDSVLDAAGETLILLAWSDKSSFNAMHKFRARMKVVLATGTTSDIQIL